MIEECISPLRQRVIIVDMTVREIGDKMHGGPERTH